MRLIDADAFCDKFDPDTVIGNTMRKIIEGEPTAYDVDKVVEQLEKGSKESVLATLKAAFKVAIDIVKSGGIE